MNRIKEFWIYHSVRAHVVAPIWVRLPEKARWRIVNLLNKSDWFCWADLVSAALCYPEDDACDVHTPTTSGAEHCANVCGWMSPEHKTEHPCSCYCGKFRFTAAGERTKEGV